MSIILQDDVLRYDTNEQQLIHLVNFLTAKYYQEIIDDRLLRAVQQELDSYCSYRADTPKLKVTRNVQHGVLTIAFAD